MNHHPKKMILKKYLRLQSLRSPFCEGRNWNDPQPMAMAYKHPYVYSCFFFFFRCLLIAWELTCEPCLYFSGILILTIHLMIRCFLWYLGQISTTPKPEIRDCFEGFPEKLLNNLTTFWGDLGNKVFPGYCFFTAHSLNPGKFYRKWNRSNFLTTALVTTFLMAKDMARPLATSKD